MAAEENHTSSPAQAGHMSSARPSTPKRRLGLLNPPLQRPNWCLPGGLSSPRRLVTGARLPDVETRYAFAGQAVPPEQRRNEELCEHIARVHAESFGVYGAAKVWLQLNRKGIAVARCTVERLMNPLVCKGFRRGTVKPTTNRRSRQCAPARSGASAVRPDRAEPALGRRHDNVSKWSRRVYLAFVFDA